MLLSLNWLREYVDIPKSISPEELAKRLSLYTVEVEKVERQSEKYKNIVIGRILEINRHPNADRLSLVKVAVGEKIAAKGILEIVCGAANIKVGDFVPVALIGASLPIGLEIKEAEIRGVKSNGMLCAPDELGLSDDHSGIFILEKAKIGESLGEYLNLNDVVIEVDNKSLTHRPDLWSHLGMARDMAAFLDCKFKDYRPRKDILKAGDKKFNIKVKVEDFSLCPRYLAIALAGIKIEASPKWLEEKLIAAGMRPINNIVDVTNYVMLELGQPLHAFDKNLVDEIVVRRAKENEALETLDGLKRELDSETLVIADSRKAIAIAGIMGGANSEISEKTESIIIEAANFIFSSIRKTSQKMALRTEASMRFEKGLDPNLAELGLSRAVELIKIILPNAKVASDLTDEKKFKLNQGPIEVDLNWLNEFLGMSFKKEKIKTILEKLGFSLAESGNKFKITVPTWRATCDITLAEDIAEEVARIYGFNNFLPTLPKINMSAPLVSREKLLIGKIKNFLSVGAGLTEVYNYSFISDEQLKKLNIDPRICLKLINPLAANLTTLRPSLTVNLLENIKSNQANEEKMSLYEIGSIFLNSPGEINKKSDDKENLPFEEKLLGIICSGQKDVLFELKGIIDFLLASLGFEKISYEKSESPFAWAAANVCADIKVNNKEVGKIAKLDSALANNYGLKKDAALAEISLKELMSIGLCQPLKQYKEYAKFPPVLRDLAFVVNEEIRYNDIKREIMEFSPIIAKVELFDVYRGQKLGPNKKNLAFSLTYREEKTLTSAEIDKLQEQLVKKLEKKFGAKIRNF